MPKYRVTDPKSGRTVTLSGDSPPTEAELEEVFASLPAAPASPAAEEPIANSGNTKPEIGVASRMAFPALAEHSEEHGTGPSFGRLGAFAKDVVSAPRRVFGAGVELLKGDPAAARMELEATRSAGVLNTIAREAPLMLIPGGQVQGANLAQRLGSAMAAGAREALPSAVYHQAERMSEGEAPSAGSMAAELATGGVLRGAFQGIGEGAKALAGRLKTGISKLSEVPEDALEEAAADPAALARAKAAGKEYGTDKGLDVHPLAERIGDRVVGENTARTAAVEGTRLRQLEGFEADLVGARNQYGMGKATRIGDISADAQGRAINRALEDAKPALQQRFVEGDEKAYGVLKDASVGPGLSERIDGVLSKWKALDPSEGVPGINPQGQRAILSVRNLASQVKTVDDLINLKRRIRAIQTDGQFEGAMFDATTDDKALNEVMGAVMEQEAATIRSAAGPERAAQILPMIQENNRLYGETLKALREGEMRFRATVNSENVIAKIEALGPEKARALVKEMESNEVLGPFVYELRNGFVDDLLRSGMKNGEFSPEAFKKTWTGLSADLKKAWLPQEMIERIEDAVKKGTEEIADPKLVGKNLFGKNALDVDIDRKIDAGRKLENIGTTAQRKALAELRALDALFGSDFTQEAVAAYRAKQLQITKDGKLPAMGNIRTGKADALSRALTSGGAGTAVGAAMGGGIPGAVAGAAVGVTLSTAGFYLQSPAGALAMFQILNRLEKTGAARETAKKFTSQGLRSSIFSGEEDEE